MVGAFNVFEDEFVEFLIGLERILGLDGFTAKRIERLLSEYLARDADTVPKIGPVFLSAHIVEQDGGIDLWICAR